MLSFDVTHNSKAHHLPAFDRFVSFFFRQLIPSTHNGISLNKVGFFEKKRLYHDATFAMNWLLSKSK